MVSFSTMLPLAAVLLLSALVSVSAHGWLSSPSSRQDQCKMGTTKNCGNIQYEPQSVEAVKGKLTCNGDVPNWAVLADDTMPWARQTVAKGIQKFSWTQTAIHPAANWVYYIQDPTTQAMTQIATFLGTANTEHCVDLSAYSGNYKMLAVWNIADTVNAFYSCVDLSITGTASGTCVGGGANTFVAPATVTTPGCTSTTTQTSYIIGAGDTLGSVAAARGLTVAQLLAVNPLKTASSKIEVGTSLIIPPTTTQFCAPVGSFVPSSTAATRASSTGSTSISTSTGGTSIGLGGTGTCLTGTPTTYTLKAGETLFTIAARVGLTIDDLMRVNSGLFTTGQLLNVPYNTCSSTGRKSGSGNSTDDGFTGTLNGSGAASRVGTASSVLLVAATAIAAAIAAL